MNEMQKGGEIPEGGAKDETENVSSIENVSSEREGGEEREGERGRGRIDSRIFTCMVRWICEQCSVQVRVGGLSPHTTPSREMCEMLVRRRMPSWDA